MPAQHNAESGAAADPLPEDTIGLEAGGGVAPGDTPPIESSIPESPDYSASTPNQSRKWPTRTPAVVTITLVALLVLALLVYGGAELVGYLRQ